MAVAHQFDSAEQQQEAATLGMWVFLATEVLFFGAMFLGYAVYRSAYPGPFGAASQRLDVVLGSINTAVLLCSSLTMAMAARSAQLGARNGSIGFLGATLVLGAVFLAIKFYEYHEKYTEALIPGGHFAWTGSDPNHAAMFYVFYFIMTGMHALHMVIGIGLMSLLIVLSWKGKFSEKYYTPVEMGGLYWHFVDIIWVFLFPLLYLVDRSQ